MDPFLVPSTYRPNFTTKLSNTLLSNDTLSSSTSTSSSFSSVSTTSKNTKSNSSSTSSSLGKFIRRNRPAVTIEAQTDDALKFIDAIIITSLCNYTEETFFIPYLSRDLWYDTTLHDGLANQDHPRSHRTRLQYACKTDNVERVEWLLKRNPHCLTMDKSNNTCLHHTLENWINWNIANTYNTLDTNDNASELIYYPMDKPITTDTIKIIQLLLKNAPTLPSVFKYPSHSPLYIAIRNPETPEDIILQLLRAYPLAAKYCKGSDRTTCLTYAILHHSWVVIQEIFLAYPPHIYFEHTRFLRGQSCLQALESKALLDSDYTDVLQFIKQYIEENLVIPDSDDEL